MPSLTPPRPEGANRRPSGREGDYDRIRPKGRHLQAADLLFRNPERLRWIVNHVGPLQVIFGGKAHPRDKGART